MISHLFFAGLVLGQTSHPKTENFALRRKLVVGVPQEFEVQIGYQSSDQSTQMLSNSKSEIIQIAADGSYTTRSTISSLRMVSAGETRTFPDPEPTERRYDKDGKQIEPAEDTETNDLTVWFVKLWMDYGQAGAKQIGDRWKLKTFAGASEYHLLGFEQVGSHRCLRIDVSGKLEHKAFSADATGTVFLRAEDFSLEKVTFKSTNLVSVTQAADPATVEIRVTRKS